VQLDAGILLRGSIDVVEKDPSGALRASDYKTGKARAPDGTRIGGGQILQPVLYALTIEKLLGGPVQGGRLYYCTSAGGFKETWVPLDETTREDARAVAQTIGEALKNECLPALPAKGACEYCDYRPICGPYEELRTQKKTHALQSLANLRKRP
jgi:CRISPR/Cas system-associated exonuclease Cas4 (RecB family)